MKMVVKAKYKNPLPEFISHGVKILGNYTYVLKIDLTGQTIIQRINSDQSEILFTKKTDETNISDFWIDPTVHSYKYFYLI